MDPRWGLNWKRGRVGDMSQDVVDYYYGPRGRADGGLARHLRRRHDRRPLRPNPVARVERRDRRRRRRGALDARGPHRPVAHRAQQNTLASPDGAATHCADGAPPGQSCGTGIPGVPVQSVAATSAGIALSGRHRSFGVGVGVGFGVGPGAVSMHRFTAASCASQPAMP